MRITIFGAGNGAFAAAAHMTLEGHRVTLSNRTFSRLEPLMEKKEISIIGGALPDTTVTIDRLLPVGKEAIQDAEVIMVCLPNIGHKYYAKAIAPFLREDQTIFLNPGHMGGGLQFSRLLRLYGYTGKFNLCETHTLTYACRKEGPYTAGIYNVADKSLVASLPANNEEALKKVLNLYPSLKRVPSVLHTSLSDHNAVMHPPGMVLNAARIENTNGNFTFYDEGTSPAVAELIGALDEERLAIASSLDIELDSFLEVFYQIEYTTKEAYESGSIYQALKQSEPNKTIMCDPSLDSRYIHEDVGFGLVPMSLIAKIIGVETPIMDSFINLCSRMNGINYWHTGLTLEKLGLADITSKDALLNRIYNGN